MRCSTYSSVGVELSPVRYVGRTRSIQLVERPPMIDRVPDLRHRREPDARALGPMQIGLEVRVVERLHFQFKPHPVHHGQNSTDVSYAREKSPNCRN